MTKGIRYTEEFKKDAVSQVTDCGYSFKEVSDRLGFSTKSLYDWIKLYKKPEKDGANQRVDHPPDIFYSNFHKQAGIHYKNVTF
jgi:transposase-like protein